ncbi:MAG TPA: ATP-binding protein [Solirubrobacteraceae bacterium]|nr:ATP-binding protein [Solirubrobacteraceae bacterium]
MSSNLSLRSRLVRSLPGRRADSVRAGTADELVLQSSRRFENIGRHASAVVHDVNNLLAVILNVNEGAIEGVAPGSPVHAELLEVRRAAWHAAELTQQLLATEHELGEVGEIVDLNAAVLASEPMLRRTLGEDVELRCELDPELWAARMRPGQVDQIVLNLALNARDAMPAGGLVAIRTRNRETSHPGGGAERWVELCVEDDGAGMPADVAAQAFQPFFTTKSAGAGTGLGLATVHGIATAAGGHSSIASAPGSGTSVTVLLPAVTAAARGDSAGSALAGGDGLSLLADDASLRSAS